MLSSGLNIEERINISLLDQCKINDEIVLLGIPQNFNVIKPLFNYEKPVKIFSYKDFDLDELFLNFRANNEEKVEVFEDLIGLKDEDKFFYKYNDERKNGIFNFLKNNQKNNNLKLLSKEQKKFVSLSTIFKKYNLQKKKIFLLIFDEYLIDKKLLENIEIEFIKTIIYWSNEKYILHNNYIINEFPNKKIKICNLDESKIYIENLNSLRNDIKNKDSRYLKLKNLNKQLAEKIDSKDSEFTDLKNLNKQLAEKIDSKDSEFKDLKNLNKQLVEKIDSKNSQFTDLQNLNKQLAEKIDSKDSEFTDLKNLNKQLVGKIDHLENYYKFLELQNLNKQLAEKIDSKHSTDLKNLNKELTEEIDSKNSQITDLQNSYEKLTEEIDSKNSQFTDLQNLNKQLVEKIDSKDSQITNLQNSYEKLNTQYDNLTNMNHVNFCSLKAVFPYKRFTQIYKGDRINFEDKENILNLFKSNLNEYQNNLKDEEINNYYLNLYSFSLFKLLSFNGKELSNIFTKQVNKNKLGSKRKFVKVIGTVKKLELNEEHNFAKKFTLYNFSNASLCTFIPKNACTSLRFSFALSNGFVRGVNDIDWIHGNNDSQIVSEKELIKCSYSFIILRSPFTRLSSYFLDKIVGNSQRISNSDKSYQKTVFNENINVEDLTFEKFVNTIWENPKLMYEDIHTTPQIEFLLFDEYDKWIALENLSKELTDIELNSGIKFFDTRQFVNNTSYKCEINNTEYFGDLNVKSLRDLKFKKILPSHKMLYNNETAYKCLNLYLSDIFLYIEKTKSFKELKSFFDLSQKYIEKYC